MEKVASKVQVHQQLLTAYITSLADQYRKYPDDNLHHLVITDLEHGHFQLTRMGWHERRFYLMVLVHFDVKPDGKIWIHKITQKFSWRRNWRQKGFQNQILYWDSGPSICVLPRAMQWLDSQKPTDIFVDVLS